MRLSAALTDTKVRKTVVSDTKTVISESKTVVSASEMTVSGTFGGRIGRSDAEKDVSDGEMVIANILDGD